MVGGESAGWGCPPLQTPGRPMVATAVRVFTLVPCSKDLLASVTAAARSSSRSGARPPPVDPHRWQPSKADCVSPARWAARACSSWSCPACRDRRGFCSAARRHHPDAGRIRRRSRCADAADVHGRRSARRNGTAFGASGHASSRPVAVRGGELGHRTSRWQYGWRRLPAQQTCPPMSRSPSALADASPLQAPRSTPTSLINC